MINDQGKSRNGCTSVRFILGYASKVVAYFVCTDKIVQHCWTTVVSAYVHSVTIRWVFSDFIYRTFSELLIFSSYRIPGIVLNNLNGNYSKL